MSVVPGGVDTDRQPPMTIPLRHFLVGLGFLVAGGVVGAADAAGLAPGLARLAHVHLLLAGWVCLTIMGAMTQFVPVWSNVALHSRRLATTALWLVAAGVAGMAWSFATGTLPWVHAFGGLALVGFWTFVYNVGRTLLGARPWDVTERHFALALCFFLLVSALGLALAMDYAVPVFTSLPVSRPRVVAAHATLGVFGAILTTVLGALYQLATMFTQTDLHGVDEHLRRVEEVGYPVGVVALATGRLLGSAPVARVGGLLVVAALLGFSVVLARRLIETRVDRTPMLTRYAVVAVAMGLWAALAARAWVADPLALATGKSWIGDPLARAGLFGGPEASHLLTFGVLGFVVLGTLYHVVPFVVWVHRYSDRLGYEAVPMIDDLYDGRIAAADFAATLAGLVGIVAAEMLELSARVTAAAGTAATLGFALFGLNLFLVVRRHSPHSVRGLLVTRLGEGLSRSADGNGETPGAAGDAPARTDAAADPTDEPAGDSARRS